jgi:HK97 family phage major capsid protein
MLGYAIAKVEDSAGFNGPGDSTSAGIRGLTTLLNDSGHTAGRVSAGSGHSTFGAIVAADLASLIALAPSWALMGAKWYCSPYAYAQVFGKLSVSAGNDPGPLSWDRPRLSYLGFEVVLTDFLPGNQTITNVPCILFGDMSLSSTMGNRRGLRIRRLTERYAEFDQIGWSVTERVDIVHHDLGDNNNPGGVVALLGG